MSTPIEMYEMCHRVAGRICVDPDVAGDLASLAFDKFYEVERSGKGIEFLRAYAWKTIAGLHKNYLKEQWRHVTQSRTGEGDAVDVFSIIPIRAGQEDYIEARQWLVRIEKLPEPYRQAISIMAGGGSITDVMAEMYVPPKQALGMIVQARRLLGEMVYERRRFDSRQAFRRELAWNRITSRAA